MSFEIIITIIGIVVTAIGIIIAIVGFHKKRDNSQSKIRLPKQNAIILGDTEIEQTNKGSGGEQNAFAFGKGKINQNIGK